MQAHKTRKLATSIQMGILPLPRNKKVPFARIAIAINNPGRERRCWSFATRGWVGTLTKEEEEEEEEEVEEEEVEEEKEEEEEAFLNLTHGDGCKAEVLYHFGPRPTLRRQPLFPQI